MRAMTFTLAVVAWLHTLAFWPTPAFAATILTYHSFDARSSMSISMAAFAAQLDYLQRSGHTVISMDELVRDVEAGRNPPDKAVVIAIDDGWGSVMKAFAELKRRDLPFTLFLPMGYVANPGVGATLSQADIDELKAYPKVTFANHSFSHSKRLTRDMVFAREDIRKSVERFRRVIGHDTPYFAYPYGARNQTYTDMLGASGFKYLFVTGSQPVSARTRPAAIPRIAAHHLSVSMLASILRDHDVMMARIKPAPEANERLVSATPPAEAIPRNVE